MAGYNFKRRSDVEALIPIARKGTYEPPPRVGNRPQPLLSEGWILLTPAGGIAARSGTTCGSASCTPYFIDGSGDLTEFTDGGGSSQTWTVYNMFSSAIGGSTYITAKLVCNVLVADAEDCS